MSQADLFLVIGILVCGFSIPALLGALADRRRPWVAGIVILIGAGLAGVALSQQSYALEEVPEAFVRVVAYFVR
ncbi:hypothetical protein P1J78_18195 [Psychromarinibacter sp. C21-152]|uniref:50S ribosomal protein L35 n=1 Tax=Psychromarinibacter sediminicola TaxID=3033385 RepID=A0AAE3NUT9_9RHOB|nr:hypothetical protein [Psychromarinibacter sediminicola]MDF0602674.1 hypothetical protein [Psychromarinibacter sediminicola]